MECVLGYEYWRACIGYPDLKDSIVAKSSTHSALRDSRNSDVDLPATTPLKMKTSVCSCYY